MMDRGMIVASSTYLQTVAGPDIRLGSTSCGRSRHSTMGATSCGGSRHLAI